MKREQFEILLAGSANEHAQSLLELEALILDPPEKLLLKLVGSGGLHPTMALAYCDLLTCLPTAVRRGVVSYSHLLGAGDLCLWLEAAAHRDIRPHATVWVQSAAPVCDPETIMAGRVLLAPAMNWATDNAVLCRDWEACLALSSKHVALNSVVNRVLSAVELRELLLIDSYDIDLALTSACEAHQPISRPSECERGRATRAPD